MIKQFKVGFILCLALLSMQARPVSADGIIVPDPHPCREKGCLPPRLDEQLVVRYHRVDVSIDGQISRTSVDQVYYNPNDFPIEGKYIFPLPADASVSGFKLWMDGKPVDGKVLDAAEARKLYEDIVYQMKDPALLEYIGGGAVQASIFPIQPGGEVRVQLEYSQVLPRENGLIRYAYPLNTEKFSSAPLEEVTIHVDVLGIGPIQSVYSPSHEIAVERAGEGRITASYEAKDIKPDRDFILYINPGDSSNFHLFTYKPSDKTDPDGFFLALMSPPVVENKEAAPKDVLLVLDRSGSMDGEKFEQARDAARYILNNLNQSDRFYLSSFNSNFKAYSDELSPVSSKEGAVRWLSGLSAAGSTDINRALQEAAAAARPGRPTYLIFITDGLPTEGVIERDYILRNFKENCPENMRAFTFGVGYDVDTFLLDLLSQGHHGASTYVKPDEPLQEVLSSFYTKISDPILTNISLDFGNIETYDIYPQPLPDLFAGSQIVMAGRYKIGGSTDIHIRGDMTGVSKDIEYPNVEFAMDARESRNTLNDIPRLWATRKIGYLLNTIRLSGPSKETVDQVVKLSIRYGIITPYTSYLVTEPDPIGMSNQERISRDTYEQLQGMPAQAPSGEAAVQKSAQQGSYQKADSPLVIPEDMSRKIRVVGAKTYILQEGVWTDTAFEEGNSGRIEVDFLSSEYFSLAAENAALRQAFALGNRVVTIVGDTIYIVNDGVEKVQSPEPVMTDPTLSATNPTEIVKPERPTEVWKTPVKTIQPTEVPMDLKKSNAEESVILAAGLILAGVAAALFMLIKAARSDKD